MLVLLAGAACCARAVARLLQGLHRHRLCTSTASARLQCLPLDGHPATVAAYAAVLLSFAVLKSWPAPACNNPLFAGAACLGWAWGCLPAPGGLHLAPPLLAPCPPLLPPACLSASRDCASPPAQPGVCIRPLPRGEPGPAPRSSASLCRPTARPRARSHQPLPPSAGRHRRVRGATGGPAGGEAICLLWQRRRQVPWAGRGVALCPRLSGGSTGKHAPRPSSHLIAAPSPAAPAVTHDRPRDLANARALGDALLVFLVAPWCLTLALYTGGCGERVRCRWLRPHG